MRERLPALVFSAVLASARLAGGQDLHGNDAPTSAERTRIAQIENCIHHHATRLPGGSVRLVCPIAAYGEGAGDFFRVADQYANERNPGRPDCTARVEKRPEIRNGIATMEFRVEKETGLQAPISVRKCLP